MPIRSDDLVFVIEILNFMTNYCLMLGPFFLVVFQIILLKSEKVITNKKQLFLIGLYAVILLSMIGFLFGTETGVDINSGTNWIPIYNAPIYLFLVLVHSFGSTIPTIYLSTKIYRKLEDQILKRKWEFFMIGIHSLNFFMYGTFTSYILRSSIFRFIWSIIGLIIVLAGAYMVFYGVGRQLEKEEIKFKPVDIDDIERIMRTSTRVNLNRMQDALGMDRQDFNKLIFKWAELFTFTIDGDYLIVNKETVPNFISYLKAKFRS
jgi:hypothetical protein